MARRRNRRRFPFSLILLVLAAIVLSIYQYVAEGRISWHLQARSMALSAWHELTDNLEGSQGEQAPLVYDRSTPVEDTAGSLLSDFGAAVSAAIPDANEHRWELVGRVTGVTDGDSFDLQVNDFDFEIRLHGVDTPEYDQPHGDEATRALSGKIDRRTVLVRVQDVDDYDRLVGRVIHQGEDINLAMVREGHGWWYRQYARNDEGLEAAEQQARNARLGLWAAPDPVAPWDWRRQGSAR